MRSLAISGFTKLPRRSVVVIFCLALIVSFTMLLVLLAFHRTAIYICEGNTIECCCLYQHHATTLEFEDTVQDLPALRNE